ncbi:TetR/AcrR family transcriptional regulator [Microbacterium sp. LWH7-1.2]|uniref:TetR/AcrR family transcriptional regulator n=1 Tax=Microbacterium sp. LWH7-1.2 TaxID=3135257 RepID=UPI003138B3EB
MVRPSKRGPRGEYAKSRITRAAILDAALDVFAEAGYRSGSLREVAQRVGITEAGLVHHFPNKPALLAAVLGRRDEHSLQWTRMADGNGDVTLRGLVETANHNSSAPGVVELYCILSAEATALDHPARGYFVSRYEVARTHLIGAFEDLERQGRLKPGLTPHNAAVATLAMMDGLQIQWLLDRDGVDMAGELRTFFATLADIDWTPSAEQGEVSR